MFNYPQEDQFSNQELQQNHPKFQEHHLFQKNEWDPINSPFEGISIDLPQIWGSLNSQVSQNIREGPSVQESLSEMQKARQIQRQKIKNYMSQNIKLQRLKSKKKKQMETDQSSDGTPKKKVKRILQI